MTRPADTSPEAWAVQNALWQRMTGDQRVRLAIRMSEDAREISKSGIRHRHPEYSEEEAEWAQCLPQLWLRQPLGPRTLRRLMLGDALFTAAWPGKPRLAA